MPLDATHYANPLGVPPAERVLYTDWVASVPLEVALMAPVGSSAIAVEVVVNHGRWIAECPDCSGAQLTSPEDRRFMCVSCANVAVDGRWRPVKWPKAHVEIGGMLDVRPRDVANWLPGETVAQLREENELLASAYRLEPQAEDPSSNPHHEQWFTPDEKTGQGHSHTWPKKPDDTGMVSCRDCGLTLPAEVVR